MTDTATPTSLSQAVDAFAATSPDWLAQARRDALAAFEDAPLPHRAAHLWRYTDPARLLPGDRTVTQPGAKFGELPADFSDGTWEKTGGYALCRDAQLLKTALCPQVAKKGVVVRDLLEACGDDDSVREKLFSLKDSADGRGAKFERASAAIFGGGTYVAIPRGAAVDRPLKIASRFGGSGVVGQRSVVVAGENSESTVVFDLSSADAADTAMIHEGYELFLEAGSRLRIVWAQNFARKVTHAPVIRARLARGAVLETITVSLGGGLTKSLLTAELADRGAEAHMLGVVFGDGRQHFDHHTVMDHVSPHTSSDLDFRTVMAQRARSVYTGLLRIGLEGSGCEAHQRNHNLLLSKRARADTIPELEILTDDVRCSHAAAVGPIDQEQLYYLESRGIDPEEARRIIVLGFLEPTVARIPAGDLQDRVRNALETRLAEVV